MDQQQPYDLWVTGTAASGPAESVTVREAVFALLRSFGMSRIFGNPGSTELPMFREFPADFEYVLGLQESVVVGMADGYAQATRNAAFVNLHSAAGVGHAMGNIFTANKNQTPLVITAGQQARAILPYDPFLFADRATELPRPYVKWAIEPARAEDVPAAIARAYYMAMQPPRGPVFVSVPVDDWDRPCAPVSPRIVSRSIAGDRTLLACAAKALASAERPALVMGAGVSRDDAWAEAIALAERHDAEVWVAPVSSRCSFPEDHRLFRGFLSARREAIVAALSAADVIVTLGGPLSIYHVDGSGPHLPPAARVFHLLDDPSLAAGAPGGDSIVTSLKAGIAALVAGPTPRPRQAPPPREAPAELPPKTLSDAFLLQEIARHRPPSSIIVEEAPSSRPALQQRLPIVAEHGFYTCASGGLGHGLPAAIGVALGEPARKVIAVLGDGSAMYAIQGLWSAAQLKLPISFVIIKNGCYQAIRDFGAHFGIDRPVGSILPDIDFCALAEGQGVRGVRVDRADQLGAALAASFAAGEPTLVEVCTGESAA